jgi:DedD protein
MMDRRVKERLIGASILVALVVLVVPELLSGPKPTAAPGLTLPASAPDPIRNVTVDLTTSKAPANDDAEPASSPAPASAAASAEIVPPAQSAAAPMPAPRSAGTSASALPASGPRAGAAPSSAPPARPSKAAAAHPVPVESAASSPTSVGRGSWSVQLGSFASRANADNLTRQVKRQGFAVFILAGGSGSSVRYRVRVGPFADRGSAERTAAKLKSLGHVGSLVAPNA